MTDKLKIELLAVALLLVALFAAVGIRGWIAERDARNQAELRSAVDEQQVKADAQAIAQRDKLQAASDAAAARQAAAIRTVPQAVQVIEHYLPTPLATPGQPTPAPSVTVVATKDLPADVQREFPNEPSVGLLGADALKAIAQNDIACDAKAGDLLTCKADLADAQKTVAARTDEATQWQTVAKGGTKWHRFVGKVKDVGCAAAGAAAGAIAGQSKPQAAAGAGVGAAAGVTVCSLL